MIPAAPTSVRRWEASHAIPKSRPSFVKDLPDAGMRSALRKEAADRRTEVPMGSGLQRV
jgi:hypothetical protein